MMRRLFLSFAILLMLTACAGSSTPTPNPSAAFLSPPLPTPRPDASCHINGALPDSHCTPGAIQIGVTSATICAPGYTTKNVRPDVTYTNGLKAIQLKEYGSSLTAADVEEDHLIPLELAGNPIDPMNLWPEPRKAGAGLGASDKDAVENATHKAVCDGKMTLDDAQKSIAADWVALRARLMNNGMFAVGAPGTPVPTEP